jgi:NFU1 iron-sulfur cluster scaffold homolog, mitochondrial
VPRAISNPQPRTQKKARVFDAHNAFEETMLGPSLRRLGRTTISHSPPVPVGASALPMQQRQWRSITMLATSRRSAGRFPVDRHSKNPLAAVAAQQQQQWRSVFVQTAETPNPESLKFIPTGVVVMEDADQNGQGFYVTRNGDQNEILKSPLATKLLQVDGVKSIFLGSDFITITKYAEEKWQYIRPELFSIIMDWADSGEKAVLDAPLITDTTILDDDDEIVAMIKELIETRIRPAVQQDGGDIRYVGFEEESGLVTVKLAGSCVGCPSSAVTLKQGVENMLMHYIPEVKAVVSLDEEEKEEGGGYDGESSSSLSSVNVDKIETPKPNKTYEERLAAAGIPFSD